MPDLVLSEAGNGNFYVKRYIEDLLIDLANCEKLADTIKTGSAKIMWVEECRG